MSTKKIVVAVSILAALMIALINIPSINQSVKADQLNSINLKNIVDLQQTTGLSNIHMLNVDSKLLAKYYSNEIQKVMSQPGCVAVRVYFGTPKEGKSRLIFVGVDKYGMDILSGVLAGPMPQCPPWC
jgi:hypothetical protein